jgi:phosphoserine phosphatase RsbU/P
VNDENGNRIAVLEQELAEEQRARQVLIETSVRLNSLLNLPELLSAIMQSATELLDAETSSLMLLDEETNELTIEVATNEPGQTVTQLRIPADRGIAGWVLQHNDIAVVNDVATDSRFYRKVDLASGFTTRSMLAVPLKLGNKAIGVVEVINKRGDASFSTRDEDIAAALSALASVAIENTRLYQKLADALVESRLSYRL